MATISFGNFGFGNFGYSRLVRRQRSRERIMPKSQQVAKIRQILSNRGAGVDTLDLVDDLVDPTVSYEDNKQEILRRVGFNISQRYAERAMVEAQCSSAISSCRIQSDEPSCEFACEECRDKESCDELKEIKESGGMGWEERLRRELAIEKKAIPEKKKSVYIIFKGVKKHRMRCPICGRAAPDNFCIVHSDVKALDLETSKKAQKLVTENFKYEKERELERLIKKPISAKVVPKKKKVVKTPKPVKKAKATKKPKPTPVAKPKSKVHEKVLTDAQIQKARKRGFVNVTIEGVKKRVTKRNYAPRKRTIQWYKSGGKISLKVVRG